MAAFSLYDLSQFSDEMLAILEDADTTDEAVIECLNQAFRCNEEQIKDRLDHLAKLVRQYKAKENAFKAEADHFKARQGQALRAQDRIKSYVKCFMEGRGETKVDTGLFQWSLQANGGKQPLSITEDLSALPDEYKVVSVSPDTDAIREALESGIEVAGCELQQRGTHVRVR